MADSIRGTAFLRPHGLGTLLVTERIPIELGPYLPGDLVAGLGLRLILAPDGEPVKKFPGYRAPKIRRAP